MVGPSEIAVIGAIVLLLLLLGRSRRERSADAVAHDAGDVWEARATIRIPKYVVSVLLSLVAAAVVAAAVLWLDFPGWVAALAGGLVAGAGVVTAMQRGRRSDGR